jgi:hypothetical protein
MEVIAILTRLGLVEVRQRGSQSLDPNSLQDAQRRKFSRFQCFSLSSLDMAADRANFPFG